MSDTNPDFVKPPKNSVNDTPLSLTLRQLRVTVAGPLYWIIIGSAIVLATMAGPYFTLERLSLAERLVFWGVALLCSGLLMTFLSIYAYRLTAQRNWNWALIAISAGIVGVVPMMGILYLAEGLATGFRQGWYDWVPLSSLAINVAPSLITATFMVNLLIRLMASDPPVDDIPAPALSVPTPPLLSAFHKKLPPHLGRDIVTVRAQDHYVEVTTLMGSAMILARLGDVVTQLEPLGLRVHRSWWVNLSYVAQSEAGANGPEITMANDQRVPVGRSYRAVFDEAMQNRAERD